MSLLPDEILSPLPGDAKGENLRYDPVYDKIKEARQEEEDDTNQGEWQRTRKKADVAAVIKIASAALATKSKDLQLAVWLAEALIRKEGFPALADSFHLLRELQVRFWENLYPELEDGNPEFRTTSQEWFAGRCDYLLRRIPMTKKGLDWFKYNKAHDTSRERAAMAGQASDEDKRTARDRAVAEREEAAQEFKESFEATPKAFYAAAFGHLEAAREALVALEAFCDEKYGRVSPSFSKARNVLEEITQAISELLDKKREKEPDEVPRVEEPAPQPEIVTETAEEPAPVAVNASVKPTKQEPAVVHAKPATPEEAFAAVARAAEFLRQCDPASVAPYMLVRSLRWAELRAAGDNLDPLLLAAPSTEIRQNLKRLLLESKWDELLTATEAAAALPCGRAWLDLHRYTWHGLSQQGYSTAAKAICSELRALLADFPSLPDSLLDDDTPVANPDTRNWLQEQILPPKTLEAEPEPVRYVPMIHQEHTEKVESAANGANGAADPFENALQLARNQHFDEAIELVRRQQAGGDSGRERFLREFKVSQLCLATDQFKIAYHILHQLVSEIEERKLLEWESKSFIVQPLSLLIRCMDKTSQGGEQRAQIYNLLCRLEPAEALRLQNS